MPKKPGMMELQERTRKSLSPKFDLKQFHRVVLINRCVPLPVLDELVSDYIQSEK